MAAAAKATKAATRKSKWSATIPEELISEVYEFGQSYPKEKSTIVRMMENTKEPSLVEIDEINEEVPEYDRPQGILFAPEKPKNVAENALVVVPDSPAPAGASPGIVNELMLIALAKKEGRRAEILADRGRLERLRKFASANPSFRIPGFRTWKAGRFRAQLGTYVPPQPIAFLKDVLGAEAA